MKHVYKERIYFLSAKRTPFGAFLGSFAKLSATDLAVHAAKASLLSANIAPNNVDHVIIGNVLQTSKDAIYLARHVGLRCEIPDQVPALTVNRLCGSGFEAVVQGARLIASGEARCVLVGGTESMTQAPHVVRGARMGLALGQSQLEDSLWECLNDSFVNLPMGVTAENLAERYSISQEEVDDFSVQSHHRYGAARARGAFEHEIAPVEVGGKKPFTLSVDEHPRPEATKDALKKLPKVFKKDGVVHAGAASGICDGASALIMCNEAFIQQHNVKPLGEFISFGVVGCDPKIMGIGPVGAIKQALQTGDASINDMSMIEVNEAFAPQVLAVQKELNLPTDKLNVHGGAIALGHPLAASGARITTHLLHNLQPNSLGIGSACIGGGQGIAVMVRSC